MDTLGLKEMGKFLWEGLSLAIAIAKFIGKVQKSLVHIMKSGLDAMLFFLLDDLLKDIPTQYWYSTIEVILTRQPKSFYAT